MKTIMITTIIILFQLTVYGQFMHFDFEQDTNYQKYFYIDSSQTNNLWQIGRPNKAVFDSAHNKPNALVTDTISTYPANNTSSFIVRHVASEPVIVFDYYYKMNSDTLVDYAKIESSVNGGLTWLNISNSISAFHQWFIMPIFSGNSNGWKSAAFGLDVEYFGLSIGDTVLFKFSFISDSIDTHKDGWMLDDFLVYDVIDIGIHENIGKDDMFQIVCKEDGEIELIMRNYDDVNDAQIQFYESTGRYIKDFKLNNTKTNILQFQNINSGMYFYRITSGRHYLQTGKIIIVK
ncbi:MAG: T9SS type A sorting domain-containing protein [Bacteroidota bacterium]